MIFDTLFIFISTLSAIRCLLSAIRCPQSTVYSPPSTVYQTSKTKLPFLARNFPSCQKGSTNYDKLYKTNPITKRTKMNTSAVLTKEYENKRFCRRAENKPKQTQSTTEMHPLILLLFANPPIDYCVLSPIISRAISATFSDALPLANGCTRSKSSLLTLISRSLLPKSLTHFPKIGSIEPK